MRTESCSSTYIAQANAVSVSAHRYDFHLAYISFRSLFNVSSSLLLLSIQKAGSRLLNVSFFS